jgi:hypothetical protein
MQSNSSFNIHEALAPLESKVDILVAIVLKSMSLPFYVAPLLLSIISLSPETFSD